MYKKILVLVPVLLMLLSVWPVGLSGQDAGDITVPAGYKVEKIAETNRVNAPRAMAFDSAGDLIVVSSFMFLKVDPMGQANVISQTRRFNLIPYDVAIAPDGIYYLKMDTIEAAGSGIYRFTSPNTFTKLVEAQAINSIAFDKLGNFYASLWKGGDAPRQIIRYDADFQEADVVLSTYDIFLIPEMVFDSANNLYFTQMGAEGANTGKIWKIPAGSDGIPGSDETPVVFASPLESPYCMVFDAADNLYVSEFSHYVIDGFSSNYISSLTRITPSGLITHGIVTGFSNIGGLAFKDNSIYVGESDRGVVSSIDLTTLAKADLTHDYGVTSAGYVEFDSNDALYTQSFNQQRLFRLNPSGQFSQVGQGIGYAQSIASDGTYFYMGSKDLVGGNGTQILKVDPIAETTEVKATHTRGWRSVAFDSYGRLILNSGLGGINFGADIIDLTTGGYTPYIKGIHNKGRCISFDGRQNLYVVEGVGDGIKKVALDKDYNPPRDISSEPLFYDFRSEPYPPAIYFFCVNLLEEVFIPLMDAGRILIGDASGAVTTFAEGFLSPTFVNFDKYGALYVSDGGNGLFKIINERWTVPAVIELNENLLTEVINSLIDGGAAGAGVQALGSLTAAQGGASGDGGIKNSLVKKLQHADKHLKAGKIRPAVNELKAFINEVKAQSGKAIPVDLADSWIKQASGMVRALEDVS